MRRKLLSAARRFAAGIDVSPREVRLVIASRKRRGNRPVRVEWVGAAPLAANAVSGAHVVDRAAVVAALSSLCARWPRRHAMRGMPCSMAIPGGGTAVSLSAVREPRAFPRRLDAACAAIDEFEPLAFDEPDRSCGLEPGDCVATTLQAHLEARVEVAAASGIALAGVDREPLAALRALSYAAEHGPSSDESYVVIWAGYGGVHGWRVADTMVEAAVRFPGGAHPDPESALRVLAAGQGLDRALVGGHIGLLERIGLTLADIGERLGCTVAAFEYAPFCCKRAVLAEPMDWKHAATYAVAFGLALRGVTECAR